MNDKLNTAIEAYAQARDAYFDLTATETLETRKNVYDCAAHQVAFLMWLDMPRESLPSSHPDFQRLIESIEQHDPLAAPVYLTDQNAFEETMEEAYWQHNALNVQALDELSGGTECRDCGTRYLLDDDARCPRCAAAKEGIEDPEPGESQEADSSDWTTAATEEDIQSWASDSRDLEDFFDEDDDWDDSDWYDDHGDDWSYYGSDDDYEEADDGSNHASRDPLSGKCYCPYCNSECAPDYCSGCHSELTPPAIDTEMRTDLPDEPPF